jgi:D-alanyl-D-alanine carboxypeptidase
MMKRKAGTIWVFALMLAAALMLCGCAGQGKDAKDAAPDESGSEVDYMVLVNYENPLPEDWLDRVEFCASINSVGDDAFVEAEAYKAYLELKKDVEKELQDRKVTLELDSAYRSEAAQQKIVDEFTEKYGADYVKQYVAVPGYSEHHTGLALDLYFIVDGKTVYENEDLEQYPEIWEAIHKKMPEYGFILRYPEGKEKITGVSYEPWHMRYVGSHETAKEITEKGVTLEEYLAASK